MRRARQPQRRRGSGCGQRRPRRQGATARVSQKTVRQGCSCPGSAWLALKVARASSGRSCWRCRGKLKLWQAMRNRQGAEATSVALPDFMLHTSSLPVQPLPHWPGLASSHVASRARAPIARWHEGERVCYSLAQRMQSTLGYDCMCATHRLELTIHQQQSICQCCHCTCQFVFTYQHVLYSRVSAQSHHKVWYKCTSSATEFKSED